MNDFYKWKTYIMGAMIITPLVTSNLTEENVIKHIDDITDTTYELVVNIIKDKKDIPNLTVRFDMQQAYTIGFNGTIKIEELCKQHIRKLIKDNVVALVETLSIITDYYKQ